MKCIISCSLWATLALTMVSCTNTEIGNSKDIEPNAIAQQINIFYSENEGLTARIKFRVSGLNGTTLVLNNPASVSLDGNKLKLDSTGSEGAYYEQKLGSQTGTHSFTYTDKAGKQYENTFTFNGFAINGSIPSVINSNQDLIIPVSGIGSDAVVDYLVDDTAFGNDISGELALQQNNLVITKDQLKKLKPGPVSISLSYQLTKPIQQGTAEGGEIVYGYQLNKRKAKLQ